MQKLVIIINGSGGVGKDSLCEAAAQHFSVQNISSITPILQVARAAGWQGEKTPAARRFLSEIKAACTAYNDLSLAYCLSEYEKFQKSAHSLLFVHIREPREIDRFRQALGGASIALLVQRPALEQQRGALGNRSDDGVADYAYDAVFVNDGALQALPDKAFPFFTDLLQRYGRDEG